MADNKALTHEQIFYDIHTYTHIYTHAFIHTHMGMADNKALTHEQMFYEERGRRLALEQNLIFLQERLMQSGQCRDFECLSRICPSVPNMF